MIFAHHALSGFTTIQKMLPVSAAVQVPFNGLDVRSSHQMGLGQSNTHDHNRTGNGNPESVLRYIEGGKEEAEGSAANSKSPRKVHDRHEAHTWDTSRRYRNSIRFCGNALSSPLTISYKSYDSERKHSM
jgi:hypothetical protein